MDGGGSGARVTRLRGAEGSLYGGWGSFRRRVRGCFKTSRSLSPMRQIREPTAPTRIRRYTAIWRRALEILTRVQTLRELCYCNIMWVTWEIGVFGFQVTWRTRDVMLRVYQYSYFGFYLLVLPRRSDSLRSDFRTGISDPVGHCMSATSWDQIALVCFG